MAGAQTCGTDRIIEFGHWSCLVFEHQYWVSVTFNSYGLDIDHGQILENFEPLMLCARF